MAVVGSTPNVYNARMEPLPPTDDRRRERRQLLTIRIVCAALFLAYVALVVSKPITQDEGVFLTIGTSLDADHLLYRDFFDHKPPAIHLLFAALFTLFGSSIVVAKVALLLSMVGATILLKKVTDTVRPGLGWYAVGIFLFLLTQFEGHYLLAESFLLFPLLLATWVMVRHRSGPWLLLAGASLALTILYKQTALLSVLPILIWLRPTTGRGWTLLGAGFLAPLVAAATYLFGQGIATEAWRQVVTLTLTRYPREPLGDVLRSLGDTFRWTLPIWVLAGLGLTARHPLRTPLWALVLVPLPLMFVRHYPHYWVQLLPFVAILAALAMAEIGRRRVTIAIGVCCLAIAGGKIAQDVLPNTRLLREQLRVGRALATIPAEALLVENQFTAFTFLVPKPPLTRYLYLTEITDTDDAESLTIDELQGGRTILILWPDDPRYAYAKELQAFILQWTTVVERYPLLGLQVRTYRAVSGR